MASKGVPSKDIKRPPPIVVEPPHIDLTVEEDMEDDSKGEWDQLPDVVSATHITNEVEEPSPSEQKDTPGLHAAMLLPRHERVSLLRLLWHPAAHFNTLGSMKESLGSLERKLGRRLPEIHSLISQRTSHLCLPQPSPVSPPRTLSRTTMPSNPVSGFAKPPARPQLPIVRK